jgi:hypothetical protein
MSAGPPPRPKRATVGRLRVTRALALDPAAGSAAAAVPAAAAAGGANASVEDAHRAPRLSLPAAVLDVDGPPPQRPPRSAEVRLSLRSQWPPPQQQVDSLAPQQQRAEAEPRSQPDPGDEDLFEASLRRHTETAAALASMSPVGGSARSDGAATPTSSTAAQDAPEPEPELASPSEPQLEFLPEPELELLPQLEPEPEPELKLMPEPEPEPKPEPEPEPQPEPEPDSQVRPTPELEQIDRPQNNDEDGATEQQSPERVGEKSAGEKSVKRESSSEDELEESDDDDDSPPVTVAAVVKASITLLILCVDLATAIVLAFCWWLRTSAFSLGYGLIFGYLVIFKPNQYNDEITVWRIPRGWLAAFLNAALASMLHLVFGIIELFDGFGDAEARNTIGARFVDLGLLPMLGQSRFGFMLPDLLIVTILGGCGAAVRVVMTRKRRRAFEQEQARLRREQAKSSSSGIRSMKAMKSVGSFKRMPVDSSNQPLRRTTTLAQHAVAAQSQGIPAGNVRKRSLGRSVSKTAGQFKDKASGLNLRLASPKSERSGQGHTGRKSGSATGSPTTYDDDDLGDVPGAPPRPGADAPPSRLSVALSTSWESAVGRLHKLANRVQKVWRKEFKSLRKAARRAPLRYIITRFVRDGVAVLCIATALYEDSIFALPYIVLPGMYVQLWIQSASVSSKRRVDQVVAHFALFDLFTTYLSATETVGKTLRDMIVSMNTLSWLDTNEPKWDYTSCALRMWIIAGYSFINLVPMKHIEQASMSGSADGADESKLPRLMSNEDMDKHTFRLAHFLAAGEEDQAWPFFHWLQGAILISSYVLCLILWSTVAVTPTSLLTLALAWFSVVCHQHFQAKVKWVMAFVQLIVFLQWCVGSGGLTLPFIADAWIKGWKSEASKQVTLGVTTVALLTAWFVHHELYGPKSERYRSWDPHMKTLHKIHSFQYSMRAMVVVILNICGLGQASGIHAVYVVAGRVFLIMEKLEYRAWIILVSFAYVSITAGLTWHLLYPPVYSFGECEELIVVHNCSTPMTSLAPYLTETDYVREECPTACSYFPTASSVSEVDHEGWDFIQEIGVHACSTAADCRFASFGWSTVVAVAVSMQIGICNFSHQHKERYQRKIQQHDENKKKGAHQLSEKQRETLQKEEDYNKAHAEWMDAVYRGFLRSISLIIIVWAFAITHSTSSPQLSSAWIFSTALVFCLAYMKLSHKLHVMTQRRLLRVLWTVLTAIIILAGAVEYAYTLSFARTALDSLVVNRMRLNQTCMSRDCSLVQSQCEQCVYTNGTEMVIRHAGVVTDEELNLIVDRNFGQQVMFFILVINGVFAYTGVTNFDKMYVPPKPVEAHEQSSDEDSKDGSKPSMKRQSSKVGAFIDRQLGQSATKLDMALKVLNKLATLWSPKIVLIFAYRASQVDPLRVIFAMYLIPVALLLSFGTTACKRVWHVLSIYACLAWMVTYVWQFKICRSLEVNDIWGLTEVSHMWDERLLAHIWVLVAVGFYRALCKGQRIDELSSEPLFEGAWPHLSSRKLDESEDTSLRLKFLASHFQLAFGQTIFFTTCLFAATVRRDNFSILYVLNLSVFFLKNRTRVLKGMQINFVLLVVVQILVCGAALTDKIFQEYDVKDPDFSGGDVLDQAIQIFLYFSRNDNDASTVPVDESLNRPSFVILFVMSAVLYNEKQARTMVKRLDKKLLKEEEKAAGDNYHQAWAGGVSGEQRLLDTIERLCFVYSLQLERSFKNLEQVKVNGKFIHACSLDEFVTRVRKGLGKKLKKHIKDEGQLTNLLQKLGRSEPWVCPREHHIDLSFDGVAPAEEQLSSTPASQRGHGATERVLWLHFCTHVSADIQDRMLAWSALQSTDDADQEIVFDAKARHLFEHFDADSNGHLDLEEHKNMYQVLEGDLPEPQLGKLSFEEVYESICHKVRADPKRGLNVEQFMCMYDGELTDDLDSDLHRDYRVAFPDTEKHVINTDSPAKRFLKATWTAVLITAVDCMALVIGLLCLLYRSSFSLIMGGYLVAALFFLRDQRSEHDFDMIRSLHKYTFLHIVAQSLFLFFDPLLDFTGSNAGTVLIQLIGLEPKNTTHNVSIYALAAALFAWIIAVSELQKSSAYSAMRLNMQQDQARAKARVFLSFASRMLDRQRALGRIEKTLQKLAKTEKRIRSRRGSITQWTQNEAKSRWHSAMTKLKSDVVFKSGTPRGPRVSVIGIETKGFPKAEDSKLKVEVRMGTEPSMMTDTAFPNSKFNYPNEKLNMTFRPNNTSLTMHARVLSLPSHKVYGIVTIENLNLLQTGDVVDEWYNLHHITSFRTRSKGELRLKFKLEQWNYDHFEDSPETDEQLGKQKAAAAMKEDVQEVTTAKFCNCTIYVHDIPAASATNAELQRILAAKLEELGYSSDTYFAVQTTIRHRDVGDKQSWALVTFSHERNAQALVRAEAVPTGLDTPSIKIESVDLDMNIGGDGAFVEIWQESKSKAEIEIEHRLAARSKKRKGHPDLRMWHKDRQKKANALDSDEVDVQSLFNEMSDLLGMNRFSPKRLATRVLMAKKKHMGMTSKEAWAELAGSSTSEQVAIFAQHVLITNSQRTCYFMIFLNQWINRNLFSAIYFIALVGCVMMEDPHVPPGFWAVLVYILQAEITMRYVLSIQYLGVQSDCEEYAELKSKNAESATGSPYPFICQSIDPTDRIDILLVLMVCVLIHEYRMKRQGLWLYWTPFAKKAEVMYHHHRDAAADVANHSIRRVSLKHLVPQHDRDDAQDDDSNSEDDAVSEGDGSDAEVMDDDSYEYSMFGAGEAQPLAPGEVAHDALESGDMGVRQELSQHSDMTDEGMYNDDDGDEEEAQIQLFEQVAVGLMAAWLRFSAFTKSFYSNVVQQDQMLEASHIDRMVKQMQKNKELAAQRSGSSENDAAMESMGMVLTLAPTRRSRRHTHHAETKDEVTSQPLAALFRKSSYKIPVDLYAASLFVEFASMGLVIFGLEDDLSSDALADVSSTNFISGQLIWMTIVQFAFIVMDRAANLSQSIPFKFLLQWLSLIVYLIIIFAVWDWNNSLAILFFLKTIYWMLGAIQIRKGYPHDTSAASKSKIIGELHPVRHYAAILMHAIPFVDFMRSVLSWIFNTTTMRYEDCVRFDEIMGMMFLIKCKFARDDELKRKVGHPQRTSTKVGMGSFLLLQFFLYAWGPMIVITFMDDIVGLDMNNIRTSSVQMDIYIGATPIPVFETKYAAVSGIVAGRIPEHIPVFVAPGYPDEIEDEYYSDQGTTLCQTLFEPAMDSFDPHQLYHTRCQSGDDDNVGDIFKYYSADTFDAVQVLQFGEYSDTTWSPSAQRMETSQQALNDSSVIVSYVLQFNFETPNNTVTPPPRQEQGRMHGVGWETSTRCTPMSESAGCSGECSLQTAWNLTQEMTNRDVLKLMFSDHPNRFEPTPDKSTLCVPGGDYTPLLYMSRLAEEAPASLSEELAPTAKTCLCMVTDMTDDRRVWQLLQAYGEDNKLIPPKSSSARTADTVTVGPGLALLTDSQKIPTGVAQSVASVGLVGLYVTVVLNMARGLKLARDKLLRNLVYEDRDAADFIYQLCQDLLTARKFAKLDPLYFHLEERLWLKLQLYLQDTGELLNVTRQAKLLRLEAREQELSESSEEEEQEDDDDNDSDDDDNGDGDGKKRDDGSGGGDGNQQPPAPAPQPPPGRSPSDRGRQVTFTST